MHKAAVCAESETVTIDLLGVRGSMPVCGPSYCRYGGATACFLVRMGGESIVLDAGTGLLSLPDALPRGERHITILLSHPHADHLLGLPFCPLLYDKNFQAQVRARPRGILNAREQVAALLSPPLWPVGPESMTADVLWGDIPPTGFTVGPVRIDCLELNHPGGCTAFRLSFGAYSVVYASDVEECETSTQALIAFAEHCSLLLIDAQYTRNELGTHRGFGHMSWETAAEIGRQCRAGLVRLIHHKPTRTDDELDEMQRVLNGLSDGSCRFAVCGERIFL